MKNWKTTILGALLAGVSFLGVYQTNGGDLGDWKLWVIPLLLQVLGYLAKDAGVTGRLMAFGLLCMILPSCEALKTVDWKGAGNRAGLLIAQMAVMKAEADIAAEMAKPKPDQKRLLALQFALMEAHNLLDQFQAKKVPHDILPQSDWTGGKTIEVDVVPVL